MAIENSISPKNKMSSYLVRIWNVLKLWLKPQSTDPEESFREKTLRGIVLIMVSVLTLILIFIVITITFKGSSPNFNRLLITTTLSELTILILGVLVHYGKNVAGAMFFAMTLMGLTLWAVAGNGHWSGTPLVFLTMSFISGMFLLPRRYFKFLVTGLTFIIMVMPFVSPAERVSAIQEATSANGIDPNVLFDAVTFRVLLLGWLMIISGMFIYFLNEFERRREALSHLVQTLETRVADRTRDLEVAAQVSTQITTVLDHTELLPQIVNLTKDSFNLYQVSVFVYDAETNLLKYEAGTGQAGQTMKTRGKQFNLAEQGLVSRAASLQKPQRVGDVKHNLDYFQEELLPNTRSELALPMVIGDTLIGVLDMQSEEAFRFTDDDLVVMQQLAKQIAIAVQNARLYAYQIDVAEELRAIDDLKSQFLASMSHELRTPLNAILNFSKFINMGIYGDVTDKQVDTMDKIIGSAQHLLSLINDVLDVTKIESGMMQLFVEDNINLHKEIDPAITTAETLLSEKDDVAFVKDIDADLPTILGDKRRLRQILLNLLSNACKFTETGTVTLSAKHKGDNILFVISDTGPGIPTEKIDLIFEPFQQTETGVKHAGGTGLGLPISKKLAESHGGRLWVETGVGEGSAFYVEIPVRSEHLLKELESENTVTVEA